MHHDDVDQEQGGGSKPWTLEASLCHVSLRPLTLPPVEDD